MDEKIETDSKALDYRIYVHNNFAKYDLDEWVFKNLELKKGLDVLDVGCGSGKHLFLISDAVGTEGSVVGADISEESLEKCREKAADKGIKNISVFNASHTELKEKLPDTRYDRVLSSFAIYYTEDKEKTFEDIYNLMKKEGILFVCGPTMKNNLEFLDLVKKAGGSFSEDFKKWSEFLEKDAKNLLEKIFGNVGVIYFENPIEFPDAETLYNYWKATPLYHKDMEEKMKGLVEEEFKEGRKFKTTKVIIGLRCVKNE